MKLGDLPGSSLAVRLGLLFLVLILLLDDLLSGVLALICVVNGGD